MYDLPSTLPPCGDMKHTTDLLAVSNWLVIMVKRRKVLATLGSVGTTVALAGCSGDTEDNPDNSGSGDNTDSEGGSGGDSRPTHEVGDTFTVGSGESTVEYTVNSVSSHTELGGEFTSEEPNGIFLVVQLEMTNQTDETIDVSSNHLKAIDSDENQFDADAGASVYVESDPEIEAEGISFEQLNPGLSTSGAVVFDVAPGDSYRLLVEPVGLFSSAEANLVELGTIEES